VLSIPEVGYSTRRLGGLHQLDCHTRAVNGHASRDLEASVAMAISGCVIYTPGLATFRLRRDRDTLCQKPRALPPAKRVAGPDSLPTLIDSVSENLVVHMRPGLP